MSWRALALTSQWADSNDRREYQPGAEAGLFVSIDGPGGVGKSTLAAAAARHLAARGLPAHLTREPSPTPLGEIIRSGTGTCRGMALACLVAGDRHHHLSSEIRPHRDAGQVVLCDRYLPSSFVLQLIDGVAWQVIAALNDGADLPDLAIILNADPAVIAGRLARRGGHSRFEAMPDSSRTESALYRDTAQRLAGDGWPIWCLDHRNPGSAGGSHHGPYPFGASSRPPGASVTTAGLSLLTFNIGNPSPGRARRQLSWLAGRDAFAAAGWSVAYPRPEDGGYGAMIVSRIPAAAEPFGERIGYLESRAAAVTIELAAGPLRVIGMYVPSRDAGAEKTERKRKWLAACHAALTGGTAIPPAVILGDLNVLEPGHQPHYPFFAPFEYDFYRALVTEHGLTDAFRHLHPHAQQYSWVGRTGDGYRYDHAFCSQTLAGQVMACDYLHEPRLDKLSDHSALSVRLSLTPPAGLLASDPAAAPATLF